jgi:hypothetical protein
MNPVKHRRRLPSGRKGADATAGGSATGRHSVRFDRVEELLLEEMAIPRDLTKHAE